MLGVIICDDDRFMLEMSSKTVRECIQKESLSKQVGIVCAPCDYNEVLVFLQKNPDNYLYFIDFDFGRDNLNGVDVAKLIKKQEPLSKIVFVTSHADMGMDILKSGVEPFGFIEKSTNKNKLLQEYKKYIHIALETSIATTNVFEEEDSIKLLIGIDEYVSLPISQILYVETDKSISHFVRYHTVDGSDLSVRGSIENVLKSLGDDFMKSHRSVIINKNYVVSVSDGLVNFAGGEKATCSFRLKNEVMRKCGVKKI